METKTLLFALLRHAVCGERLKKEIIVACTPENLEAVHALAKRHDLSHLVAYAVDKLDVPECQVLNNLKALKMRAIYRYLRLDYDLEQICKTLEAEKIPFIPLKGAILRKYYPEPWMRTSCDVDVLVKEKDCEKAAEILANSLSYCKGKRRNHDIDLRTPTGSLVELHFDMVEEGRANTAKDVLSKVWIKAVKKEGFEYWHELPDELFYFYHIAHMAKHLETGGCGIRPFIDLWFLRKEADEKQEARVALLKQGELAVFEQAAVKLSSNWFGDAEMDDLTERLEKLIFNGGTYGSISNRVALNQKSSGGSFSYMISRIFAPYEKMKSYYPVLEKHRWLMPLMQIRRWLMLLESDVAFRAKKELKINITINKDGTDDTGDLLNDLGICKSSW